MGYYYYYYYFDRGGFSLKKKKKKNLYLYGTYDFWILGNQTVELCQVLLIVNHGEMD